jgi:predicted TPR repeat methyltransferase
MNWKAFAMGDYANAQPASEEEVQKIQEASAHLLDVKKYAEFYNRDGYEVPPEFHQGFPLDNRLQRVLELLLENKCDSVLDVGCRVGLLLFHMATRGLLKYGKGVDINSSAIQLANDFKTKLNLSILDFEQVMFEEYKDPIKYDCIVMTDVLEHCISPEVFLERATQLTNKMIVSFPVDCPDLNRPPNDWKYQEHVRLLDKEHAGDLFKKTGWNVLSYSNLSCYFLIDVYLLGR